jgi:REP element-mobilizing transposase RayT
MWHSRGYLPHFDIPGLHQSLTFRLADSLPIDVNERLERAFATDGASRRRQVEAYLGKGWGTCVLRDPNCAEMVENSLLTDDGKDYRLLAWVIMPNHVHVLIATMPGHPVATVVQRWKGGTARAINRYTGRTGVLWQREYWDRFIRDEAQYLWTKRYIEDNPLKAGLVREACTWRWSSAWWRGIERTPDGNG